MRSPSLRFLIYLEWLLLAIVAVSEIPQWQIPQLPRLPLLNLIALGLFTLLGLRLPARSFSKLLYTILEIALIHLVAYVGGIRLFQLLYIVFVIRNCLLFSGYRRSGFTLLVFILCILTQWHRFQYFDVPINPIIAQRWSIIVVSIGVLVGLVMLFLQLLVNALLQLATANDRLRQYALKIEDIATLQERNRIARDIHDSLGHSLTVLNLHLEAAIRLLPTAPEETQELLQEAKQVGSHALQEVRQSVAAMRSDPLRGKQFSQAIANLISDFQRSTGISPNYNYQINTAISQDVKTAIYRLVQESLTNISKYASATEVNIYLQSHPNLQVTITDNGSGFDSRLNTTGFGIQGMRERVLALSGQFILVSSPGKGCQITAIFPLTEMGNS
ncbi:sensor histidine kinase [Calothrix sp. 336/3]|uniref:sensor histidine kinase n=1 Tax=Calothrix sp. 336/3 TaxID=1337936 RepID=UPI0005560BE5|nr:sensor histidine kinase [Calothrix sp. 336/3]AKG23325.1 hypothetical protein IJ00_20395 [Calothrix sp. 336/3]